jgi:hypothetical protein
VDFNVVNDVHYFSARDTEGDREPWRWYHGITDDSPVLFRNINTAGSSSPLQMTSASATLFFSADYGTGDAPAIVADINPSGDSMPTYSMSYPNQWSVASDSHLYFQANDGPMAQSSGAAGGQVRL